MTARYATSRIGFLDGWRGCAILCVLLGHFISLPGVNFGRFGVELFFVLSGRLMAEILFVKEKPLGTFFVRRFSRVYPAFLVFVALVAISGFFPVTLGQVIACLTFTYNYFHSYSGGSQALDHIWSLCIEEHIYILLAIIAFLHRRFSLPLLPILVSIALAMMLNGYFITRSGADYYAAYWRTDTRGASILCGVIAYLLLGSKPLNGRLLALLPVLLGIGGLLLNWQRVPDPIKYSFGTAFLASSLALLPSASNWVKSTLAFPWLRIAGLLSFSLYLWQQPLYIAAQSDMIWVVYALILAIILAAASYLLVEKPARLFLNRWFEEKKRRKNPLCDPVL